MNDSSPLGVDTIEENINKKTVVNRIRKEIEESKETHIWGDFVNALNLISQVVFTRSSGFILELIQNAEDAGLGLSTRGIFEIKINKERVKVTHNGRPFSEIDAQAICGIRSSKKPEKGTIGIGFKSVFKVTDRPEIYSNGFQFKFDRNHPDWEGTNKTPWHVLPIWIDQPSETIDSDRTTFIIPFREETYYTTFLGELRELKFLLYLFLRWLKKIEITDEISGQVWAIEDMGENEEGITTLKQGNQEQRYKIFRRVLDEIPDWVKKDRLTQEYRANVTQREIAIAFHLDKDGNLAPLEARAMYGVVSSFSPLGEERSGAKFPIQADFLVQPGREAINYEAKWNHWLIDEVTVLCKDAIDDFKKHEKWRYQFLPVFEFTKYLRDESYNKLFGPKLIDPIEKFLHESDCGLTVGGGWAKLGQMVRLNEDQQASEDLIALGVLQRDEIAPVMGGQSDLKLVDPRVKEPYQELIRKVDRWGLLQNDTFLEEKRHTPDAANWFRALYLWLAKHPVYYKSGKSYQVQGYQHPKIVLASSGELLPGGKVLLPDLPPSDPILRDLVDLVKKSKPLLHPNILASATDEEQKTLRGFLTGLAGVQILDSKTVCRDVLLPKILIKAASKPLPDDLLKYTIYCQQILGNEVGYNLVFWVLTKQGEVRSAKEVFFPAEYKPEPCWEFYQKYVPGLNFISPRYLNLAGGVDDQSKLEKWREFFKLGGLNDAPNNGVEVFAENYVEDKLKENGYTHVEPVDKLKLGYDRKAKTPKGEQIYIEVKGQATDHDVELKGHEVEAADTHKDSYFLCIISSIPENPAMHMVKNPAAPGVGEKDKLTIPVNKWKATRWS
jgi:hypothetical protein